MNDLFNENKVDTAVKLLKLYEPVNGYFVADSGGKDSSVMRDLCKRAKVKAQYHYNITTVDPPELTRFIHEHHPETKWLRPLLTMRQAIIKKRFPPTRIARFCCQYLKEWYQPDGTILMGIRRKESVKRGKRKQFEMLHNSGTFSIFPIFEWSNEDIWDYIKNNNVKVCELYNEGYKRLGCVMCPLKGAAGMKKDAKRWPHIAKMYKKAFQIVVEQGIERGKEFTNWQSGEDVFNWWITNPRRKKKDKNQVDLIK